MKYGLNIKELEHLIKKGQNIKNKNKLYDEMFNYSLFEFEYIALGFENKDKKFNFEPKIFYRIGKPRLNDIGTVYTPSFNFATEKKEKGVSCISLNWLNSFKAVFFNITDERIKRDGIWEIKGIEIAKGGDDEPLIIPIDWAKKTNFTSIDQVRNILEK